MMKKTLALCGIVCALLCGCSPKETEDSPTLWTEAPDAYSQIALDAAQTKITYYEELVNDLQKEILDLKATIYTNKVEYEEQIAGLVGDTAEKDPLNAQFEYVVRNGEAILLSYKGSASEITIPDMLGGFPVTAIADRAFENNVTLSSVAIPSGVQKIGWFAFSGCVFLTDVALPASLQSVEYGAFENCSAVLTVHCPQGSYAQSYARSYGFRTVS